MVPFSIVPPETSVSVASAVPVPTCSVAPASFSVPVTLTMPPVWLSVPSCANVKVLPRFSVPPLTLIEPLFDQAVELMSTVSPLETLRMPALVKLTSPMVKVPPAKSALIVPALTMPLPARSS